LVGFDEIRNKQENATRPLPPTSDPRDLVEEKKKLRRLSVEKS
jgi:hypothetical protein